MNFTFAVIFALRQPTTERALTIFHISSRLFRMVTAKVPSDLGPEWEIPQFSIGTTFNYEF